MKSKALVGLTAAALAACLVGGGPALAGDYAASKDDAKVTDESKVRKGAREVESGAKKAGEGVKDTATGVGKTVAGGAEKAGEKIKDAGEAAKPAAKGAWDNVRDGARSFGHGVKTFFSRLFSSRDDTTRESRRS